MAGSDTTTIRVGVETRNTLRTLAARRGEPAGEVVAKLVQAADEEAMLAEAALGFERIAADPRLRTAYRLEISQVEDAFDAGTPDW